MKLKKILLEDKKGNYSLAKLKTNKHNLKPSKLKINKINPNYLEEFKDSVKINTQSPNIGENYPPIAKDYMHHKKEFANQCMNNFLNSLDNLAEKNNAKYLLLKDLKSEDMITRWQISAEVHYLR